MTDMLECTTVRARVDQLVHGELPAPEDNDIRYLKIPLDAV